MHIFLYSVRFHVSVQEVVIAPFVVFSEARFVFSGRPPLGYDALLCFCYLAYHLRVFFTVNSFCALSGVFCCVFVCLGPICWSSRGLLVSFFASWIRKGTYLCHLVPPDHQLGGKWGHQVDFCPSPGVDFRTTFCYCFVFFGMLRFCGN